MRTDLYTKLLAAALLGVLGACGGGAGAAAPESAATPVVLPPVVQVQAGTWVVMGSSTPAGAGAPPGKGWVALMQGAYSARGVQVANIAKGASSTYEGLSVNTPQMAGRPVSDPAANIDQALVRRPVLLVLSYPSNDTSRGYSVDETVNNLLAMRSQALAAGVPVIVLSSQPRNLTDAQLAQMRVIDTRLAASIGPCFVEVRERLADPTGRLAPVFDSGDGVHPNSAGHEQIFLQMRNILDSGRCIKISP